MKPKCPKLRTPRALKVYCVNQTLLYRDYVKCLWPEGRFLTGASGGASDPSSELRFAQVPVASMGSTDFLIRDRSNKNPKPRPCKPPKLTAQGGVGPRRPRRCSSSRRRTPGWNVSPALSGVWARSPEVWMLTLKPTPSDILPLSPILQNPKASSRKARAPGDLVGARRRGAAHRAQGSRPRVFTSRVWAYNSGV